MPNLRPTSWFDLAWLFGVPTLLNLVAARWAIPSLEGRSGMPIEAAYFLSIGGLALMPMFCWALYLSGREIGSFAPGALLARLRVKRLTAMDWVWTVGGFVFLSVASLVIAKGLMPHLGVDARPFFFRNLPLSDANFWILYVWPAYFFFNIFGEEFLWRGYIQPRQELLNGRWTWLVHGLLWIVWHLPLGLDLILAASPIFFVLPAIIQVRKNTSISIIIHAVFGAMGFLALSLGFAH